MLISPSHLSDFLLAGCRERGEVLTNLKLQKLLFYSQAWSLALNGQALFDEDFQAWIHGPVLPSQYARFKDFSWHPITMEVERPVIDTDTTGFLGDIIDEFGSESAVALELMTHREQPWIEARGNLPPFVPSEAKIPKTSMQNFYRQLGAH